MLWRSVWRWRSSLAACRRSPTMSLHLKEAKDSSVDATCVGVSPMVTSHSGGQGPRSGVAARINTALAPGDQLYTGERANLELQVGARAFVRAGAETQLGIENQEPDFLQIKVTAGHASIDLRSVTAGHAIELDTPNAVFTIDRTGYYRRSRGPSDDDVHHAPGRPGHHELGRRRDGGSRASERWSSREPTPPVRTYAAPEVDDWDRWNYDRTDNLIDSVSARYVSPGVYGADALDHYGDWRVVSPYGAAWVPGGVSAEWAPYSTGRWMWDPYYDWTWIDEAPWGWAPYH